MIESYLNNKRKKIFHTSWLLTILPTSMNIHALYMYSAPLMYRQLLL